jgi:hypothetical protein
VVIAANSVALIVAGLVAWRLVSRARAIEAALAKEEAPFLQRGFVEIATNALTATRSIGADVPGGSCFVVAATDGAAVVAQEGSTSVHATGSAAWCACSGGHVAFEAQAAGEAPIGLAILRIEARAIGGPLARAWLDFAPGAWGDGGSECADGQLDAWIGDGRLPKSVPEQAGDEWFSSVPSREPLRTAGFRVIAEVPGNRPFGAVDAAGGDCMLAIGPEGDSLSLRATGGARLVSRAPGALAWCDSRATTSTVWHEGSTPVAVLAVAASRVGGLLGVRECADQASVSLPPEAVWLREEDLPADAEALLRASAVQGAASGPLPREPGAPDPAIVAFALPRGTRTASEPSTAAVACDPSTDEHASIRETICAAAVPVTWWRLSDAPAAVARAPLPFWLAALELHHEPDAVARIPELVTLARRLVRTGFEPTVLESVTEVADGVRVTGRAGEDAVVAVGVGPKPPWVFPYSDGVPWDLGDAPRVVPLHPGASVRLASSSPSNVPIEKRRTIVFRHVAHP